MCSLPHEIISSLRGNRYLCEPWLWDFIYILWLQLPKVTNICHVISNCTWIFIQGNQPACQIALNIHHVRLTFVLMVDCTYLACTGKELNQGEDNAYTMEAEADGQHDCRETGSTLELAPLQSRLSRKIISIIFIFDIFNVISQPALFHHSKINHQETDPSVIKLHVPHVLRNRSVWDNLQSS